MKILFICSSLEPEQDGVGDYTRKLAQALIFKGNEVKIIALNDRRMNGSAWQGKQADNNIEIEVLRLPENSAWKSRINAAKKFADDFNPDWISLQFVPFGFQIKGLPFSLDKKLKCISKAQWHVMFHELSVNKNESFKFRVWAFLQVMIIKSLLRGLKPLLITTNTEIYQHSLKKLGYKTAVLPLFSNIQRTVLNNAAALTGKVPGYLLQNRTSYTIGTLFGTFSFKSWDLHSLLNKLVQQYEHGKIIIASIGKMSSGKEFWDTLKTQYPGMIFLELGMQDISFISYWLSNYTDFGILTTLPELSGKSGSFMAFKEHGIPVLCNQPDGQLKSYNIQLDESLTIVPADNKLFTIPKKREPVSLLDNTADNFIQLLNISQQATFKGQR